MFEVGEALMVGELPVLDIQAPPTVEAAVGHDHSLGPVLRDSEFGSDFHRYPAEPPV
jgi:hypothetical protein